MAAEAFSNSRRRSRSRSLSKPYTHPSAHARRKSSILPARTDGHNDRRDTSLSPGTRKARQEALTLIDTKEISSVVAEQEEKELEEVLAGEEWSASEATLFNRIRRRGREALFPATWKLDFGTYPEVLYVEPNEEAYLAAMNPKMQFRGAQSIQHLVSLGGQVRDRLEINAAAPVEPLIYNEIKRFISWAEKDASISLSRLISLSYNRDKKGTSEGVSERMEKRMRVLAASLCLQNNLSRTHSETNKPSTTLPFVAPSVIYGVTVFNCVVALSSLNVALDDIDMKTLVVLDFSDPALDLWNAIAIALMVTTARNDILSSDVDARLDVSEEPDEDA